MSSAYDAPGQAWPFLAVLMSTSPANKGDDGSEPARVRGLGFVHGDVIVTLAHIAKEADIAQLPDETMPLRVRQTAAEGALALMEFSSPPKPQLTVRPLSAGERVNVALVSDISPSVHLVSGFGRPSEPDERFTVTLDGRLGEDETASGSPVVAGDAVVGIVGPEATNGWVSAFGAEAVRRLLATHAAGPSAPPPLSAATLRALGYALDVVDDVGPGPAVLLGVLRTEAEGPGESVLAQLLSRLNAGREGLSLEREVDALRGDARNDPKGLTDEQIRNPTIGRIVHLAESVQVQVGDERLHRRHLLAAALSERATEFSLPTVERIVGLPLPDLRQALREIIAGIYGPNAAWDALLAEPAPLIDLAGGVSADLVDPTTGIPLTEDHLGLGVDVTMFATLIADKKTPMPLSIGLFGEWGSGKSYFMGCCASRSTTCRHHPTRATAARSSRSASTHGNTRTATYGRVWATRSSSSSPGRRRSRPKRSATRCAPLSTTGYSAARSSRRQPHAPRTCGSPPNSASPRPSAGRARKRWPRRC